MTPDAPIDILVHAGFHKTGTSSLQAFLQLNETALSDQFLYYGKDSFAGIGARARRYGQRPFPWRLRHFRKGLRSFLADVPDGHRIVLSRETFSGIMPGHKRFRAPVASYQYTAPRLARIIVEELRLRFGQDARIAFLYSTRETQSWKRSVFGHLLRSIRLTKDFKEFAGSLTVLTLTLEAEAIQKAIPDIPVYTSALEQTGRSLHGPATAVLDLMEVPAKRRERLTPVGRVNGGNSIPTLERFLALNRKIGNKALLKREKDALLDKEKNQNA